MILFKEIFFSKITKPSIITVLKKVKDDPLDLSIEAHSRYFSLLKREIESNTTIFDIPIGGKVTTYEDFSKEIIIVYKGKNGKHYEARGNIETPNAIVLSDIKETNDEGLGVGFGKL